MRRLWLAIGVLALWWWWRAEEPAPAPDDATEVRAAVLRNGFALHVAGQPHRVREISRKGPQRAEHVVDRAGEVRVVGTRSGATAAWLDTKKVRLVALEKKRELGVWGKSARMLCEGVASNDERFGVGWLEADDSVWFVHGPTTVETQAEHAALEPMLASQADPKTWCGLASAEGNIALFWRDRDRLFFNMCTKKKCASLPAAVAFPRSDVLLGFGCLRNACLVAARDKHGKARLAYLTESGSTKWTRPLATDRLAVSIVGAGSRAFAVGYVGENGAEVLRVEPKGATSKVWQGAAADGVPALAWSNGQLLVGQRSGAPSVIPFPR